MSLRWVVDDEHPTGYAVEMTPGEQAQADQDAAAGAALLAAQAVVAEAVASRSRRLREAREQLAAGKLFATLADDERDVLALLLEGA